MITVDKVRQMENQSILKYARKFTLPLPDTFIESNNVQSRDEMEVYREIVNGRDALIIIPKVKEQTEPEKLVDETVVSES